MGVSMANECEGDKCEAHVAQGRYVNDFNLTRFHENAMLHLTGEVRDPLNRAIILSDRFGKFDANPFARREGGCSIKTNDSATESNVNNSANGDVDGG